jgi:5-methylcytosine-specific restriction endonuclease McrA
VKAHQELFREYLLTVREGTDEINHRRKREQILRRLLETLFERKDSARLFSAEQRRILWNTTEARKCITCKKSLTWEDFTIDHINPHSKGGRTALDNAALMCRKHNSAKGNRVGKRAA